MESNKKESTTKPNLPKSRNTGNNNTKYWRKQKEDYDLLHNLKKTQYFAYPPFLYPHLQPA